MTETKRDYVMDATGLAIVSILAGGAFAESGLLCLAGSCWAITFASVVTGVIIALEPRT